MSSAVGPWVALFIRYLVQTAPEHIDKLRECDLTPGPQLLLSPTLLLLDILYLLLKPRAITHFSLPRPRPLGPAGPRALYAPMITAPRLVTPRGLGALIPAHHVLLSYTHCVTCVSRPMGLSQTAKNPAEAGNHATPEFRRGCACSTAWSSRAGMQSRSCSWFAG